MCESDRAVLRTTRCQLSRRGVITTCIQLAGIAFAGAMTVLGSDHGWPWAIAMSAGIGIGITLGLGVGRVLEDAVHDGA